MLHSKTFKDYLQEYALIVVGSVIYAAGFRFFYYPNDIIAGGVTGIAMIINYLTEIPVGVINIVINIPLFILAWRAFGLKFIVGSFVATMLSSVLMDVFALIPISVTDNLLLAAIYGGVIGAVLGMLIYTRVRKLKIFPFLDLTGIGLLLGQAIGRWGNFFNREAHGGVTTCFLRMGLVENGELQYFHPTFLYESVWNLTGFVVLHFLSKKRKFDGQMFLAYLAWYGAGRMVIEGLRTDSLWLGPVRVSQLLAAVTMLLSLGILLYQAIFVRHDPAKMQVNCVAAAEAAKAAEAQPEETAEPEDAASEPEDEASGKTEESIEPDESKE